MEECLQQSHGLIGLLGVDQAEDLLITHTHVWRVADLLMTGTSLAGTFIAVFGALLEEQHDNDEEDDVQHGLEELLQGLREVVLAAQRLLEPVLQCAQIFGVVIGFHARSEDFLAESGEG